MKKRKRRLGHITSDEKQKVRTSVDDAHDRCLRDYGPTGDGPTQRRSCIMGVSFVETNLARKGFSLSGRRRR
jgi:hypothetical protein